jgi:hypothetical protein
VFSPISACCTVSLGSHTLRSSVDNLTKHTCLSLACQTSAQRLFSLLLDTSSTQCLRTCTKCSAAQLFYTMLYSVRHAHCPTGYYHRTPCMLSIQDTHSLQCIHLYTTHNLLHAAMHTAWRAQDSHSSSLTPSSMISHRVNVYESTHTPRDLVPWSLQEPVYTLPFYNPTCWASRLWFGLKALRKIPVTPTITHIFYTLSCTTFCSHCADLYTPCSGGNVHRSPKPTLLED